MLKGLIQRKISQAKSKIEFPKDDNKLLGCGEEIIQKNLLCSQLELEKAQKNRLNQKKLKKQEKK